MSTAYYYFAASLPLIEFGENPPVSSEDFLRDCERLLSEGDYQEILKVAHSLESASNNALIECWRQYNHNLRNEAAWLRANELNKEPMDYIRGERIVEPEVVDVLAQAVKSEDPLSAERMIDQARWNKLEELLEGHYFDFEFLVIYFLKIQILERYEEVGSPKGKERLEEYKSTALNNYEFQLSAY